MGLGICVSSDYVLPARLFSKDDGSFVNLELRLWTINGNILSQETKIGEHLALPPEQVKLSEFPIVGCFYTLESTPESETPTEYAIVEKKILPMQPTYIFKVLEKICKNDSLLPDCTDQTTPLVNINGLSCPCKICKTEDPYVTLYAKVHRGSGIVRLYDNRSPETLNSKD
jgi:hypothetical protein